LERNNNRYNDYAGKFVHNLFSFIFTLLLALAEAQSTKLDDNLTASVKSSKTAMIVGIINRPVKRLIVSIREDTFITRPRYELNILAMLEKE